MAIKQFIGMTWDKNKCPQFILNSSKDKKFHVIPAQGKISLKKLDRKFCVGYYDLDKLQERPCPQNKDLTNAKFKNCWDCQKRTGFKDCLGCNGHSCLTDNRKAKKFCQNPHLVYLVYFGQDIYKVGTAVEPRSTQRLLEQGASYSCFWARADGRTARQIEYYIGKQGIKKQLTAGQKMNLFIQGQNQEVIFAKLREKLGKLLNAFPEGFSKYLIEPVMNNYYPSNLPNVLYQTSGSNEIDGEIIAVVGPIMLIKKDCSYIAINLKPFFGWLVDIDIESIS